MSAPICHASDISSVVTRVETGVRIRHKNTTKYQVYTRYILVRVATRLFSWGMVANLLAFSSRELSSTINHAPFPLHTILPS